MEVVSSVPVEEIAESDDDRNITWNCCNSSRIVTLVGGDPGRQQLIRQLGLQETFFGIQWPSTARKAVREFVKCFDQATMSSAFRGRTLHITKEFLREAFNLPKGEFSKYKQKWTSAELDVMFSQGRVAGNPLSVTYLVDEYREWEVVIRMVGMVLLGKSKPTQVGGKHMWYFYAHCYKNLPNRRRSKALKPLIMPDWADLVYDELGSELAKLKTQVVRGPQAKKYSTHLGTPITQLLLKWGYTFESGNDNECTDTAEDGPRTDTCEERCTDTAEEEPRTDTCEKRCIEIAEDEARRDTCEERCTETPADTAEEEQLTEHKRDEHCQYSDTDPGEEENMHCERADAATEGAETMFCGDTIMMDSSGQGDDFREKLGLQCRGPEIGHPATCIETELPVSPEYDNCGAESHSPEHEHTFGVQWHPGSSLNSNFSREYGLSMTIDALTTCIRNVVEQLKESRNLLDESLEACYSWMIAHARMELKWVKLKEEEMAVRSSWEVTIGEMSTLRTELKAEKDEVASLTKQANDESIAKGILQNNIDEGKRNANAVHEYVIQCEENMSTLQGKLEEKLTKMVEKTGEQIRRLQESVKKGHSQFESEKKRADEAVKEVEDAKQKLVAQEAEMSNMAKSVKTATEEIAIEKKRADEASAALTTLQEEMKNEVESVKTTLKEREENVGLLQETIEKQLLEIEREKNRADEAGKEVEEKKGEQDEIAREKSVFETRKDELAKIVEEKVEEIRRLQESVKKGHSQFESEKKRADEAVKEVEDAKQKLVAQEAEMSNMAKSVKTGQEGIAREKKRADEASAALTTLQEEMKKEVESLKRSLKDREENVELMTGAITNVVEENVELRRGVQVADGVRLGEALESSRKISVVLGQIVRRKELKIEVFKTRLHVLSTKLALGCPNLLSRIVMEFSNAMMHWCKVVQGNLKFITKDPVQEVESETEGSTCHGSTVETMGVPFIGHESSYSRSGVGEYEKEDRIGSGVQSGPSTSLRTGRGEEAATSMGCTNASGVEGSPSSERRPTTRARGGRSENKKQGSGQESEEIGGQHVDADAPKLRRITCLADKPAAVIKKETDQSHLKEIGGQDVDADAPKRRRITRLADNPAAVIPIETDQSHVKEIGGQDVDADAPKRRRITSVAEKPAAVIPIETDQSHLNQWSVEDSIIRTKSDDSEITGNLRKAPAMASGIVLHPHQRKGIKWMCSMEDSSSDPKGGILADEQGMGKTVQLIGLMLLHREYGRPTLICCPKSVMRQWEKELERKVDEASRFKVLVYEGKKQQCDYTQYEIVIASHTAVRCASSVPPKAKKGAPKPPELPIGSLEKCEWLRIVVDECQVMKSSKTSVSLALCKLQAEFRWCVSGTPFGNKMVEWYSYARFLEVSCCFTETQQSAHHRAMSKLADSEKHDEYHKLIVPCLLRRKKVVLGLPPPDVSTTKLEFKVPCDILLYNCVKAKIEREVDGGECRNSRMLTLILRARQVCVHRELMGTSAKEFESETPDKPKKELPNELKQEIAFKLIEPEDWDCECANCEEVYARGVFEPNSVSVCAHTFCSQCTTEAEEDEEFTRCPACGLEIGADSLYRLEDLFESQVDPNEGDWDLLGFESPQIPAKFEAIMAYLKKLPKVSGDGCKQDTTEKAIIFSQWPTAFEKLEAELNAAGIRFRKVIGSMTLHKREVALSEFSTLPEVTVILLSLHAASSGLNITAANHVLFMDQWWNPAVEDQAVDRCHRMGQTKQVYVKHFVMTGTVEEQIVACQASKRKMAKEVLHGSDLGTAISHKGPRGRDLWRQAVE